MRQDAGSECTINGRRCACVTGLQVTCFHEFNTGCTLIVLPTPYLAPLHRWNFMSVCFFLFFFLRQ